MDPRGATLIVTLTAPLCEALVAALEEVEAAGHEVLLTCEDCDNSAFLEGSRWPARGLNEALRGARGEVVVWLSDALLPSAALMEGHLAFHRGQRRESLAVGTVSLPSAGPLPTLAVVLRAFDPVLSPSPALRGEQLGREHASAPAALLRGGVDEGLAPLARLPDLGMRHQEAGVALHAVPTLTAQIHRFISLDVHLALLEARAAAWVGLMERHPSRLLEARRLWGLTRSALSALPAEPPERRAAAAALAALDSRALRGAGETSVLLAGELAKRLAELLAPLEARAWADGVLRGMDAEGIFGFGPALARYLHHPPAPSLAVIAWGPHATVEDETDLQVIRVPALGARPGAALQEALDAVPAPWVLFTAGALDGETVEAHRALLGGAEARPFGVLGSTLGGGIPLDRFARFSSENPIVEPIGSEDGAMLAAAALSLRHLSLPTEALRAAGGFGRDWEHLAAVEADLSLRLGLALRWSPALRAPLPLPSLEEWLEAQYHRGWASAQLSRAARGGAREESPRRTVGERADALEARLREGPPDDASYGGWVLAAGRAARLRGLQVAAAGFEPNDFRGGVPLQGVLW